VIDPRYRVRLFVHVIAAEGSFIPVQYVVIRENARPRSVHKLHLHMAVSRVDQRTLDSDSVIHLSVRA